MRTDNRLLIMMLNHFQAIKYTISGILTGFTNYQFTLIISESFSIPVNILVDFIKSQPIKKLAIWAENVDVCKIIDSIKYKINTLINLHFSYVNFENIDLSCLRK